MAKTQVAYLDTSGQAVSYTNSTQENTYSSLSFDLVENNLYRSNRVTIGDHYDTNGVLIGNTIGNSLKPDLNIGKYKGPRRSNYEQSHGSLSGGLGTLVRSDNTSIRETSFTDVIDALNETLGIQNQKDTPKKTFTDLTKNYNRYKKPKENLSNVRGYGHVFFVRPSCNIYVDPYSSTPTLTPTLVGNQMFEYANSRYPDLVKQLCDNIGTDNFFMLSLSNLCVGLSINDESLAVDSYGKSYTGFQISYGKTNNSFKTAGTLTLSFTEDKELHVYHLHKLWMEYISKCYRGQILPDLNCITHKILDYASAIYYIVTAEDGETILYWSKFYGAFPTDFPTSEFSYRSGEPIRPNEALNITYAYSFREDFDPQTLMEFNYDAQVYNTNVDLSYVPIYDPELGHSGSPRVGSPFIELVDDDFNDRYEFKLRFRKKANV